MEMARYRLDDEDSVWDLCTAIRTYYNSPKRSVPLQKEFGFNLSTDADSKVKAIINWENMYCTGFDINNSKEIQEVSYPPEAFDLIRPQGIDTILKKTLEKGKDEERKLQLYVSSVVCEGTRFGRWWIEDLFLLFRNERGDVGKIMNEKIQNPNEDHASNKSVLVHTFAAYKRKSIGEVTYYDLVKGWKDCTKAVPTALWTPKREN